MHSGVLYCDESGDFDSGRAPLLLGGVLLRRGSEGTLRADLEAAAPGAPWPLHAAHLRRPSFLPALAALDGRLARRLGGATERAAARLLAPGAPKIRMKRPGWPDVEDLYQADRWLQKLAPTLFAELDVEVKDRVCRIEKVLDDLPDLQVIAAWSPPGGRSPSERYLELWDTLLERLVQSRASMPGVTILCVPAAARDTVDHERLRERSGHRRLPWGALTVVVSAEAAHYGTHARPELVLADFVVNRLRTHLRAASSWSDVASQWGSKLEVVLPWYAPGLPTVAAVGRPRERIRAAIVGNALDAVVEGAEGRSPGPETPAWAQEQAEIWFDYAANRRAGGAP